MYYHLLKGNHLQYSYLKKNWNIQSYGSIMLMIGLDDLKDLSHPKWFCDSVWEYEDGQFLFIFNKLEKMSK